MRLATTLISLCLLTACSTSQELISEELRCHVGSYRLNSGALIDIGLVDAEHLRWRTLDGRVGRLRRTEDTSIWSGTEGWTERPHPARIQLGDCGDQSIKIAGIDGVNGEAVKVLLDITDVRFQGEEGELAGRLVLPKGDGPVPITVLVHGSEDYSALDYAYDQRLLPAQGIGVFVYDKRGTGASAGSYSQDFHLLAADAAAAHQKAIEVAGERLARSGYFGASQGGWVAPLAAEISAADFVIASYGLAEGPLAEDRDEVQLRLRHAGFGEDVLSKAREVTDITGRLLASDFQDGAEDLKRVREAYGDEAWFEHLNGGVTWEMVSRPLWQFRMGYFFLEKGTSWDYNPLPVLRGIDAPMLWVLAGDDTSAPSENTREILAQLQAAKQPIDVAFFPHTEHGIIRFVEDEQGERQLLGYTPGYFALLADWILNQKLADAYESAELAPRSAL